MSLITRGYVLYFVLLLASSAARAQAPETAVAATGWQRIDPRWTAYEPRFREQVCPFETPKRYADRTTCGYVLVPEDRTTPQSRLIKLAVMRIAAPEPGTPERAVVLLTGGPGEPGIDTVNMLLSAGLEPTHGGDFVAFDQRGTGYSDAEFCRAVRPPWLRGVPILPDGEQLFRDDMRSA